MAIRRILVPVDYSSCSAAALDLAAGLAQGLGAKLDVVHVWDRPHYVSEAVMVRQPNGESRSLVDMIRENAESEMDDFLAGVSLPTGVVGEKRLVSGNPVARILEEVRAGGHDLVVIGTHGRTGVGHVLLGSVAERLVQRSNVPVLTVPRPS